MNYTIITDEQKLQEFIDWLPELEAHEKYYFSLFARSKYTKGIAELSADKAQLKRGVSDKARLMQKLRQLEIAVGGYELKGKPVPQEALAVYITVNPRDMKKATANTLIALATSMRDQTGDMNPHSESLSQIQKAKGRTCYIDFDIDESDETRLAEISNEIRGYVNEDAITLVRTRGGLHCLIDPQKVQLEYKKSFFQKISAIPEIDQTGDQLIPVPGCYQGGFTPHFES